MHILQRILLLHVLTCLGQNGHGSEIIHGHKVPEGSMLYMVSVQNNAGHVCGGFLISEKFVVTAAHCDINEPTHVVLATHNLKNPESMATQIEQRYKPETYKSAGQGDDIMLLKLSRKVQPDNRVKTIRLPQFDTNIRENQLCRVAGWGITESGHGVDELRMADVYVINSQVCTEKWSGLPDNVICAGAYGTNRGFCQGDSGGPLVCNGRAVGVVSFNRKKNCTYPDVPNVYTDVSKHLHWINKIINANNTKH